MKQQMRMHGAHPVLTAPRIRSISYPRRSTIVPPLTLLLVLGMLVWVGLQQLATPSVVPATAPATEFSAERAMEHLRVIAAQPRVLGSAGHIAAQQYLVEQLQSLGLSPEIQTTTVLAPSEEGVEGFAAATVRNIVARLPGTDSTGAIALNAHYDSGSTGPGAMDAGSGVVTVLETVRAIQAGPTPRNDLIIVFADAEEVGMLGAAAFTEQHPWAADVRLALNYEGAGGSGPAILYATSDEDRWLVSEYLDIAPHPSASSLLTEIDDLYAAARLDCDLGEYTDSGSAGLGFVVLGDTSVYHTALDNPDRIDVGSIQQEGANTLAAVRHFGTIDLATMPRSGSGVFFNIWPGVVTIYSASLVVPLALIVTALIVGIAVIGVRRGEMRVRGLIGGAATFLLGTLGAAIVTTLVWIVIRMLNTDYQVMLIGSYQSTFYVVALTLATIAIMASLYLWLGRRMRRDHLMVGVLIGALLPLWIASLAVPGMSYLVTWPLLFATLPVLWGVLTRESSAHPWTRLAILAIAAVPTIVLLPGTLHGMMGLFNRLEGLSGIGLLGVLMLFVAPLVGLLTPHIFFLAGTPSASSGRRWAVPAAAALTTVAMLAWGIATADFDAEHPRPNQIAYHLNTDTGVAEWVSFDRHLDEWTEQFFPADAERGKFESVLLGTLPAFVAPAPAVSIDGAPEARVLSDATVSDVRSVELRITSPRGARLMAVELQAPGEVIGLQVDNRAVDLTDLEWARDGSFPLIYHNPPAAGWTLTLEYRSTEPLVLEVESSEDGLPEVSTVPIAPRPADMMPAPGYARDPIIVTRTFTL